MNIQEAIALCIDYAMTMRSESTGRTYENALNKFIKFLDDNDISVDSPLSRLSIEHFKDFPKWLRNQYNRSTSLTYISGMKFFYEWLILENHIEPSLGDDLRVRSAAKSISKMKEYRLPRFPDLDDAEKMVVAVKQMDYDSPIPERNEAIFKFLISTGCRVGEITKIEIKDIDSKIQSAIVEGKGRKERRVFINKSARDALLRYWGARGFRGREDPIFARHDKGTGKGHRFKIKPLSERSIVNICQEAAAIAGIEQFTPHYFRHWFAIKFIHENGNVIILQQLLGHESLDSTQVYAKAFDKDVEDAHEMVFG
jgi:integrase